MVHAKHARYWIRPYGIAIMSSAWKLTCQNTSRHNTSIGMDSGTSRQHLQCTALHVPTAVSRTDSTLARSTYLVESATCARKSFLVFVCPQQKEENIDKRAVNNYDSNKNEQDPPSIYPSPKNPCAHSCVSNVASRTLLKDTPPVKRTN